MKKLILIATASLIALSQAAGATTVKHNTKAEPAHQASGQPARLGSLSCTVAGGVGMVLGSSISASRRNPICVGWSTI
jgi:hypothetical protein